MKHVIDGVTYHVEVKGEGLPLVLFHGFTGDSTTWEPFYSQWGKDRQLIAIDIIGHGQSDSPDDVKRYDMLSVIGDIKKVLENLNISKADMLGYSMGGRVALSFAIQYPNLIRKLILESASPGLVTEKERRNRRKSDEKLCQYIVENGIARFVNYWENIPLFSTQKLLSQEEQEGIRRQRLQNNHIGLCNSLKGMGTGSQPSWWGHLKNFPIETLLLAGMLDEKFCTIAKKMEKLMLNAKWVGIEESGHAIHVEQREKFGTIVSGFLSKGS